MTGITKEQAFYILWGNGRNLKSTILNVLEDVIGEYAIKASTETFMAKRNSSTSGDLVRLRSARLVKAVETDMSSKLAENLIKVITGGDGIVAREIYQKDQQFDVEFKLLLATNNKPIISHTKHPTILNSWITIYL
jgi:putative DNA primase/helicase